jgi:hypothetical protein
MATCVDPTHHDTRESFFAATAAPTAAVRARPVSGSPPNVLTWVPGRRTEGRCCPGAFLTTQARAGTVVRPRRVSFRAIARHDTKGTKMTSKNLLRIALVSAALACSNMAFAETKDAAPAKGAGTRQTHHCKQSDGTMDMGKTKKACLADKGTWLKDAPPAAAAAAPAPAASAAPKK